MTSTATLPMPDGPLVIFGGASGIGLATATLAGNCGTRVILADVSEDARELDLVQENKAEFCHCDATDPDAVATLLGDVAARHGSLGAVITTVGGAHPHDPLLVDLGAWRKEIAFNLESAYVVATTAARLMRASDGGSIVTTSSTIAQVPRPERAGYAAAKAGVIAFTKALALAVAGDGVRVNCVAPNSTDTPRFRNLIGGTEAFDQRVALSPQKRICVPEDIAHTILFLASESARSITGQVVWVNNGAYMP